MSGQKIDLFNIIPKLLPLDVHIDLKNPESIIENMNLLQKSHWIYQDTIMKKKNLPSITFKDFIFVYQPRIPRNEIDNLVKIFNKYKKNLAICGAIMLNENKTKLLLVRNSGTDIWSYPKGKKEPQENEELCVTREVLEETNYNISEKFRPENKIKVRKAIFFIIENVPEDALFVPWNCAEISEVRWFKIEELSNEEKFNIYIRHSYKKLSKYLGLEKGISMRSLFDQKE